MSTGSSARGLCGGEDWPPGFRFHPTDEELVLYYLKRKICRRKIRLNIIRDIDVYKWDPEELPGQSLLKTGDRQWFFFSPRERRYPNATRLSRATRHGYWKATGKDRIITCNSRDVGVKKTLVFYEGRAPNGERTDWVMHEYTLDEDELKRCKNVQDYYALYKLFKKSGPGPKNGEQYGAPFKEEEWADDECQDINTPDGLEPHVKLLNEVTSVVDERQDDHLLPSSVEIDDFLKQIANAPVVELPEFDDYRHTISEVQVEDKEETGSTLVDAYSRGYFCPEADKAFQIEQPGDLQASFDFTQSGISHLQSFEGEVSSAPKFCEDTHIPHEDDFLEIDDLIDPSPASLTTENPSENMAPVTELDGLSELDLFHDVDMFLRELGPITHETALDPYLNVPHSDVANHFDGDLQRNQMDDQLWKNFETGHAVTLPESCEELISRPSSGVGYEPSSNSAVETRQNQRAGEGGGGSASWFSSNLWAFVESIPTTPASASENVNRALERVTSFSRLRINALNSNVTVGNPDSGTRRAAISKGFIFFSILGVLCAILWMFIGNIRLWGRSIAS